MVKFNSPVVDFSNLGSNALSGLDLSGLGSIQPSLKFDEPVVDFNNLGSNALSDLDLSGWGDNSWMKENFKDVNFDMTAGITEALKENPILPDLDMSNWNLSSNILGGGIFGGSAGTTGVQIAPQEPSTETLGPLQEPSIGAGQRPSIGFLFPQPWRRSEQSDNYRPSYEEPTLTPLNIGIGIALSAGTIYYLQQNKMI